MSNSYSEKISRVCQYILENLESDFDLDLLATEAGLSKFHFHRLFTLYTGVSPVSYAQLMRFKQASYQLVFQLELKVVDVALDAGFESHEAFSRAFKRVFQQTPSEFRKNPEWEGWHERYEFKTPAKELKVKVEVVEFPGIKVACLEHHGSHTLLNNTVSQFIQWRKETGLAPIDQCKTFGVVYSDPNTTEPEKFRFDVCAEIEKDPGQNSFGVIAKTIPQGKCARVRHEGPHEQMDEKIYALYRDWLPESGEKLRDYPLFFHYHNILPLVKESELVTDIYLPLD